MAYRLIPPGLIAINIGADETDFLAELRTPGTEVPNSNTLREPPLIRLDANHRP